MGGLTNGVGYTFRGHGDERRRHQRPQRGVQRRRAHRRGRCVRAAPAPRRIVDSRLGTGQTDDGQQQRFGALPRPPRARSTWRGAVGLANEVENVVLSVVAVAPTASGFLTVWSCDGPRPSTSSMNYTPGVNLAGTVLTRLGADDGNIGNVCIYTSQVTDLVIDVPGALGLGAFFPLPTPQRLVDSRKPFGTTDDGTDQAFGALSAHSTRTVKVASRVGVDSEATNAVLTVVAASPTAEATSPSTPAGPRGRRPPA